MQYTKSGVVYFITTWFWMLITHYAVYSISSYMVECTQSGVVYFIITGFWVVNHTLCSVLEQLTHGMVYQLHSDALRAVHTWCSVLTSHLLTVQLKSVVNEHIIIILILSSLVGRDTAARVTLPDLIARLHPAPLKRPSHSTALYTCFCLTAQHCTRVSVSQRSTVHVFLSHSTALYTCFCLTAQNCTRVSVS